jgi:DNA-binding HxlR family transcriptional regulator/peroxiredoxin
MSEVAMPRPSWSPDPDCAIAQAVAVVGEGWNLLIVRDVARGRHRFDELAGELGISRKVLTERLRNLIAHDVLFREPYQHGPTRYAYRLTARGRALLPVLISLQDWGDRWLLGDGDLTATAGDDDAEARRVRNLVGTTLPDLALTATTNGRHAGELDVVDPAAAHTVLFGYPATGIPGPLPDGWSDIPGAVGCTLENRLFRDAYPDFQAAGVAVRGFSTQRPDEQRAFAVAERIDFPLLSDTGLRVVAALRLPTFRAADAERVKRVVLVLDADRTVREVRYPVTDIAATVAWARHVTSHGRRDVVPAVA